MKLLSVGSRQGKGQFVAEIVAISSVLHRNLVKLYGCCFEGEHRMLVYEYLPNGSLDQALFGNEQKHDLSITASANLKYSFMPLVCMFQGIRPYILIGQPVMRYAWE